MINRREALQVGIAAAAITAAQGLGPLGRVAAQQRLTEAELLKFDSFGNVTLLHMSDIHGQLVPVHLREPSINLGIGEGKKLPQHLPAREFLTRFGIPDGSAAAYSLTAGDFDSLAKTYGRIGGLDRAATVIKAVRAERGNDKVLLLDGGDTWQGSYGSYQTRGQDMVDCFKLLKPDAMTGHWEFSYGEARVKELVANLGAPFLALNMRDNEWQDPVFEAYKMFEKGGVKVAVLGQAFPFTFVSLPRWMVPNWSFGIREEDVRATVEKARKAGADLVVLLSHNGFEIDLKLASRVEGIDVILTAHTHDPLPEPFKVGKTLLIAGGSHGKFVSRLDLEVANGQMMGFRYKLIPLFADAIRPDPEMKKAIEQARAPFAADLSRVVGYSDTLLYRRGSFGGSFDDLICAALMQERDTEFSLSAGFWWGTSVLPGAPITVEDIHNVTSITFPQVCRTSMTGARLKEILEEVADNLVHPDPYYRQGGDMIRCGGFSYTIDIGKPAGQRISDMASIKTGQPIDAGREYIVASWACGQQGADGPPAWEVLENYIARSPAPHSAVSSVKVAGDNKPE
jgi:sulfur-oxidizing protein SoxB